MSEKGFKIEIKSARFPEDDDFHAPYIGHSNAKANDMAGGTFHQHIEADHPYMIRFKGTPAVKIEFGIKDAEKGSVFRFSFCAGKGNRLLDDKVLYQRAVFTDAIGTCTTGRLSTKCEDIVSAAIKESVILLICIVWTLFKAKHYIINFDKRKSNESRQGKIQWRK